MISYDVKVNIGGKKAKDVQYDKEMISGKNFKGKKYPYYENSTEGTKVIYKEASEISLPIDILISCDEAKWILFDSDNRKGNLKNPVRYTKKQDSKHAIRIVDDETRQIGYTSLSLNEAGDITERYSHYQNKSGTHEMFRFMQYELGEDEKKKSYGTTGYIEKDLKEKVETEVTIYEEDKEITQTSIARRKMKEEEMISITDFTSDITEEEVNYYATRCHYDRLNESLFHIPRHTDFANYVFSDDLTKWKRKKQLAEEWEKNEKGSWRQFVGNDFLEYIEDDENDLMKYIPGDYAGHLFERKEDNSTLYIRTRVEDFDQNAYFYYTKVDLTDCDPFVGTNPLYEEEERDERYFERIKSVRGFEYVTKLIEGEEMLIWAKEKDEQAQKRYEEQFVDPYQELTKIKTGKISGKKK